MMRPITLGLKLFMTEIAPDTDIEVARSRKSVLMALNAVVYANILWLTCFPKTPTLYQTKIIYQQEPPGEETFADIPTVIEQGWGDCDDLSAWRCAELRYAGIAASPYLKWRESGPKQNIYHACVRWPDGRIEDPSLSLGMAGHEIVRVPLFVGPGPMPKPIGIKL